MFNEVDLMIIEAYKKMFYSLPGASICGFPVGQIVSLTVILYALGEAALYLMPNTSISKGGRK